MGKKQTIHDKLSRLRATHGGPLGPHERQVRVDESITLNEIAAAWASPSVDDERHAAQIDGYLYGLEKKHGIAIGAAQVAHELGVSERQLRRVVKSNPALEFVVVRDGKYALHPAALGLALMLYRWSGYKGKSEPATKKSRGKRGTFAKGPRVKRSQP